MTDTPREPDVTYDPTASGFDGKRQFVPHELVLSEADLMGIEIYLASPCTLITHEAQSKMERLIAGHRALQATVTHLQRHEMVLCGELEQRDETITQLRAQMAGATRQLDALASVLGTTRFDSRPLVCYVTDLQHERDQLQAQVAAYHGTAPARLRHLLTQLERRFPDLTPWASRFTPEDKLLAAIDQMRVQLERMSHPREHADYFAGPLLEVERERDQLKVRVAELERRR